MIEILECPAPQVWFDENGKVVNIKSYCVVNGWTISFSSITKKENKFFESCFDEHHEVDFKDRPVEWEKIDEEEKRIFKMTRKELETTKLEGIYSNLEFAN